MAIRAGMVRGVNRCNCTDISSMIWSPDCPSRVKDRVWSKPADLRYTGSMSTIHEAWRGAPPALPEPTEFPDPLQRLRDDVETSFWHVLACEHDGLIAEADEATVACLECASRLRAVYDVHPALGPDAADAMIAWAVHYARISFASDLKMEKFRNWRVRRDKPPAMLYPIQSHARRNAGPE
jgi:hypothetical protein